MSRLKAILQEKMVNIDEIDTVKLSNPINFFRMLVLLSIGKEQEMNSLFQHLVMSDRIEDRKVKEDNGDISELRVLLATFMNRPTNYSAKSRLATWLYSRIYSIIYNDETTGKVPVIGNISVTKIIGSSSSKVTVSELKMRLKKLREVLENEINDEKSPFFKYSSGIHKIHYDRLWLSHFKKELSQALQNITASEVDEEQLNTILKSYGLTSESTTDEMSSVMVSLENELTQGRQDFDNLVQEEISKFGKGYSEKKYYGLNSFDSDEKKTISQLIKSVEVQTAIASNQVVFSGFDSKTFISQFIVNVMGSLKSMNPILFSEMLPKLHIEIMPYDLPSKESVFAPKEKSLKMVFGNGDFDNIDLEQDFILTRAFVIKSGKLERIEHLQFQLPQSVQGGGIAKEIFRKSLTQYQAMGAKEITTTANISAGGYVWLRYGFVPVTKDDILKIGAFVAEAGDALLKIMKVPGDAELLLNHIKNNSLAPISSENVDNKFNFTIDDKGAEQNMLSLLEFCLASIKYRNEHSELKKVNSGVVGGSELALRIKKGSHRPVVIRFTDLKPLSYIMGQDFSKSFNEISIKDKTKKVKKRFETAADYPKVLRMLDKTVLRYVHSEGNVEFGISLKSLLKLAAVKENLSSPFPILGNTTLSWNGKLDLTNPDRVNMCYDYLNTTMK